MAHCGNGHAPVVYGGSIEDHIGWEFLEWLLQWRWVLSGSPYSSGLAVVRAWLGTCTVRPSKQYQLSRRQTTKR